MVSLSDLESVLAILLVSMMVVTLVAPLALLILQDLLWVSPHHAISPTPLVQAHRLPNRGRPAVSPLPRRSR